MPQLQFVIASLLCFLAATIGFEALANTLQTQTPVLSAIRESIHTFVSQPIGNLLLAAPFFGVGVVAANLAKGIGPSQAKVFFVSSAAALAALYFSGYWTAQQALLAQQWTAAALSVGLLPFKSILILVLAAISAGVLFWRAAREKT